MSEQRAAQAPRQMQNRPSACSQFFSMCFGAIVSLVGSIAAWCGGLCGCGKSYRLNGRKLRAVKILGEGAYAQVHEVIDPSGAHLAMKRLLIQEPAQRALAHKEIRVHQSLGNLCAYAMPLLDHEVLRDASGNEEALLLFPLFAESMHDMLERRATTGAHLDERVVLQRIAEVCVATQLMHNLAPSLAHRDIKPANIMLTHSGNAVLADFGSAAPATVEVTSRFQAMNLQEEAEQFCSMPYRAPELFDVPSRTTITAKTDVWSIGCTLYALVYGYSPFECEFSSDGTPYVVECSHLRVLGGHNYPSHNNHASEGMQDLIDWILDRDPATRPSVAEVLARLHSEFRITVPGADMRAGAGTDAQPAQHRGSLSEEAARALDEVFVDDI